MGLVTLRYPRVDDVQALLDFINPVSAEQTFIMFQGVQLTLEQEREWLAGRLAAIRSGDAVFLVLDTGERIVGTGAVYRKPLAESHVGVFGITVSQDFRNIGLGRELMRRTLAEAEAHLEGLKIIELSVFANNERAHRMYLREGFVEHGSLPGGVQHRDVCVDHILMHRVVDRD